MHSCVGLLHVPELPHQVHPSCSLGTCHSYSSAWCIMETYGLRALNFTKKQCPVFKEQIRVIINMQEADAGPFQRGVVVYLTKRQEHHYEEENVFFPNFNSPQISQISSSRSRIT